MTALPTLLILAGIVGILLSIAYLAARNSGGSQTTEDFVVGGRAIGTTVLLLSMGATYFSTWTLLGSFGAYFREGIWFAGFAVWTIFHGVFVWLFGTRIWLAGKRFGFITPGQMIEHYYDSKRLRLLSALVGITALVPVMLIQVSGGARALETLTEGAVPYALGVTIASLMVGAIVLWAGFRGTAWSDMFLGTFFAAIMIFTALYVLDLVGGLALFARVAEINPDLVTNPGKPTNMLELFLGLGFGAWVLPHMWQKFYSAKSAETLGKVAVATPFWNSWMMAIIPLIIGLAAVIPGVAPGVSRESSDTILPQIFAEHAPVLAAFVVAGILAAAISTINSQLLSSASLVAEDIWGGVRGRKLSDQESTRVTRLVVAGLTLLVFVLALTPGGAGHLVPVAALGFGLGLQLVPSALGILYFRRITEMGAFAGLLAGVISLLIVKFGGFTIGLGAGTTGIVANIAVTALVSLVTRPVSDASIENYHGMFARYMGADTKSQDAAAVDAPATAEAV
ncbi:sodium:solute symporter family protein [Roseovarius sp. CAU 1744]|uniref:sodium:solute symporter family protein n=1 Tax=Roseovarius sp. CAU 1744 TaxID=3140368 RepID=UPI00325ADCE6